jgi:dihydrofolate synthase/folylpolyglutamate synthase
MPAEELEKIAVDVFGRDRVTRVDELPDAIQTAVDMVDVEDELGVGYGHGVLVAGSFVTAGDARALLAEHVDPDLQRTKAERVHQPAVEPEPRDAADNGAAAQIEEAEPKAESQQSEEPKVSGESAGNDDADSASVFSPSSQSSISSSSSPSSTPTSLEN